MVSVMKPAASARACSLILVESVRM